MLAIEASYLPQIRRLHRLKRAGEVSIYFPALNLFGRLLSFAYTLHAGESVLAMGFLAGIALRATFLTQVVHYRLQQGSGPFVGEAMVSAPVSARSRNRHPHI